MSVYKITLKDGTEYTLADASFGSKFTILCDDRADFLEAWDSLTPENIDEVTISSDDTVVTTIRSLILDGAQAVYGMNGTVTGHFYFHGAEYDAIDPEFSDYIEAARILLGEEG